MRIFIEKELAPVFVALHESGYFKDGKEISDAVLKSEPKQILEAYQEEKDQPNFDLMAFFHTHFDNSKKQGIPYQSDTNLSVKEHIEKLWSALKRQPDAEQRSTLIPLKHPYIVPGGRFNEVYYWDSYFTMLGLELSGRIDEVESMVDNFSDLILEYGFIPNGNRTYFLTRSQPPFFPFMVMLLVEHRDAEVLIKYLPALEKEYAFWMEHRSVDLGDGRILNRYYDSSVEPRTEMYQDDMELISKSGKTKEEIMPHIRAACESGWDFSSRWCEDPDDLSSIHTADILPVDLNCLLYHMEYVISKAYAAQANMKKRKHYKALAEKRKALIEDLFWSDELEFYTDYDFVLDRRTERLSLAGVFPLYVNISGEYTLRTDLVAKTLKEHFLRDGGLITTPIESGQQWDAPNGWAPLQWIAASALYNNWHIRLALDIAEAWLELNEKVYKKTGKMLEKYNVMNTNLETGGGEYPVQDGFGWTNGVFLKLFKKFRDV